MATKTQPKLCEVCKAEYRPRRRSQRFCSRPCLWSTNGGANRNDGPIWWKNPKGYIEGRVWVNGRRVYRKQHRWLMEQVLGRPLLPNEDVHHKNGVKDDNRIENLEVVEHGSHSRVTNTSRVYRRGYKMNLSQAERDARSRRMKAMRAKSS